MLAISTTWNYSEDCDLKHTLHGITDLGLSSIELGYNFTVSRLNEIIPLITDCGINVVSVHNFCPLPAQNVFHRFFTNYYYPSSPVEEERKCAVKHTKETIDTAARLNAKAVVIHAGTIEMDTKPVKELIKLYNSNKISSSEAINLRENILRIRRDKKEPYFDSTVKSLGEITEYAAKRNIKIGLENRYYPNEIPDNDEAEFLLKKFENYGLVYWHDLGHGLAQERLGFIGKNSLLDRFGGNLFGFHLHGIKGLKDHLAPLSGQFDFTQIAAHLKRNDIIKVIESHQPATAEELKETIRHFKANNWL
jgi:sugar phosphate isomerase/epimerase